jgi:phytoene dehydrogenase-like protein
MAHVYDAVIIGGGHNGLVTAAYLAEKGVRTIVLERRPFVGGASVTEEPWPGYKVSTYAYVLSLLRREVVRDLKLKKHGLTIYPQDPPYFQPYPDGRTLMVWNDYRKTHEEISKFSKRDADVFEEYESTLNRLAEFIEPLMMTTPPDPTSSKLSGSSARSPAPGPPGRRTSSSITSWVRWTACAAAGAWCAAGWGRCPSASPPRPGSAARRSAATLPWSRS